MTPTDNGSLFDALDGTWPAAEYLVEPPWTLRRGASGGQRVSAATANTPVTEADITTAEHRMKELGQRPLFMIRPGDESLDTGLQNRGYTTVDPVAIYLAEPRSVPEPRPEVRDHWPPDPATCALWESGGIGPARIAVMERARGIKTCLSLHQGDASVATAFLAIHGGIAMLHALEVSQDRRRQGLGRTLMEAAFAWSLRRQANWFALMVTRANEPANALYRALGMSEVGRYHYRRAP